MFMDSFFWFHYLIPSSDLGIMINQKRKNKKKRCRNPRVIKYVLFVILCCLYKALKIAFLLLTKDFVSKSYSCNYILSMIKLCIVFGLDTNS